MHLHPNCCSDRFKTGVFLCMFERGSIMSYAINIIMQFEFYSVVCFDLAFWYKASTLCCYLDCLKEQYPIIVHAPNFDFWRGCCKIKRCEEIKRTLKNPFVSRLAESNTTLKLLRITDQWYIVPVKFRFGRNLDFLALLLLPLAGGPKDWKHFDADWRLISSASFHTSSDNCERNTQKWNSNNKDCKKETIETLMWLRRSCGGELREAECFVTTH